MPRKGHPMSNENPNAQFEGYVLVLTGTGVEAIPEAEYAVQAAEQRKVAAERKVRAEQARIAQEAKNAAFWEGYW